MIDKTIHYDNMCVDKAFTHKAVIMYPNLVEYNPSNRENKPVNAGKFLGSLPYHFPRGTQHVHFFAKSDGDEKAAVAEFEKLTTPQKTRWGSF